MWDSGIHGSGNPAPVYLGLWGGGGCVESWRHHVRGHPKRTGVFIFLLRFFVYVVWWSGRSRIPDEADDGRFESLVGKTPFIARSSGMTRRNIRRIQYDWPDAFQISAEAKEVVSATLAPEDNRATLEEISQRRFLSKSTCPKCTSPPAFHQGSELGEKDGVFGCQSHGRRAGVRKKENDEPSLCLGKTEHSNPIRDAREGKFFPLPWTWEI